MQLDFDDLNQEPPKGPASSRREPISLSDMETLVTEPTADVTVSELETVDGPPSEPAEPVSMRDLEMIFAPGVEPPSIEARAGKPLSSAGASGADEVPDEWSALAPPIDKRSADAAKVVLPRPAGDRAASPTAAPRATARKIRAPRDSSAEDLKMMEAIAVPVVTPKAPRVATNVETAAAPAPPAHDDPDDERPPDSRITDLRQMVASHDKEPAPTSSDARPASVPARRRKGTLSRPGLRFDEVADEDVFNLSGGLFAPDLTAPDAARPNAAGDGGTLTPTAAPVSGARDEKRTAAPAVTRSKTDAPAPRASGRAGLWLGAVALLAAIYFLARKRTDDAVTPTATAIATEQSRPPAATATATVATKPRPVATADEPSIDDAPASAPSAAAKTAAPVTATPATPPAPSQPAPGKSTAATAPPPATAAPAPAPTTPAPAATADAPATGPEFDKTAAAAALAAAAADAASCKAEGDPSGVARVAVTFAPSGRVTSAVVSGPPFAGTTTGGCIARKLRGASVPPFDGSPVIVNRTVTIP